MSGLERGGCEVEEACGGEDGGGGECVGSSGEDPADLREGAGCWLGFDEGDIEE